MKNTNYVPPTLKEVLKKIKINRTRARNKKSTYKFLNKEYKKLNWTNDRFLSKDIKPIISDDNFKCFRRLKSDKEIKPFITYNNKNCFYSKENIEFIYLLRELSCTIEEKFMMKKTPSEYKKTEYVPYRFNSAYRGDIFICSIPKSKIEKSKLVTEWLHKKEFLFDEDSPFFKGSYKTRRFIEKNLINGKIEKWDYYLQRFISENDK